MHGGSQYNVNQNLLLEFASGPFVLETDQGDRPGTMQAEAGNNEALIPRDYQQELLEKAIRQNVCSVYNMPCMCACEISAAHGVLCLVLPSVMCARWLAFRPWYFLSHAGNCSCLMQL